MTRVPLRLNHIQGGSVTVVCAALLGWSAPSYAKAPESPSSDPDVTAPVAPATATERTDQWLKDRPWSVGVMAGYYFATKETWGIDVDPLTFGFGLNAAWSMKNGVWFGLQGQYFLGSTVDQTLTPLAGYTIDVAAKTKLIAVGGSVGFDLPLGPVVFRNVLELGASIETWDFDDAPFYSLGFFTPMQGTKASFYMAPGIGVLVPLGPLEIGPELRYRLDFTQRVPSAMGAQLHAGWRF